MTKRPDTLARPLHIDHCPGLSEQETPDFAPVKISEDEKAKNFNGHNSISYDPAPTSRCPRGDGRKFRTADQNRRSNNNRNAFHNIGNSVFFQGADGFQTADVVSPPAGIAFVSPGSIVREIWGKADTVLFIFAGAAAEFALNKAVDWLYFTGRLPEDPLGRLFSTVTYSRKILFSGHAEALKAIDTITAIHKNVENARGTKIPDRAYRDVLFMLIDYSIRSFEVLERRLSQAEKTEVLNVFNRLGGRMGIEGLPGSFAEWVTMRQGHLDDNLDYSNFTKDLYKQYKKHLGSWRYLALKQVQLLITPQRVNHLLKLGTVPVIKPVLEAYKFLRRVKSEKAIRSLLLPNEYKAEIAGLDISLV